MSEQPYHAGAAALDAALRENERLQAECARLASENAELRNTVTALDALVSLARDQRDRAEQKAAQFDGAADRVNAEWADRWETESYRLNSYVEQVRQERDALRAALARFGRHGQACPARPRASAGIDYPPAEAFGPCDCGYGAAMEDKP